MNAPAGLGWSLAHGREQTTFQTRKNSANVHGGTK
jgi:hypothetical protein